LGDRPTYNLALERRNRYIDISMRYLSADIQQRQGFNRDERVAAMR